MLLHKYKLQIMVYVFSGNRCGYTHKKIVYEKFIVCAAESSKCSLLKKHTSWVYTNIKNQTHKKKSTNESIVKSEEVQNYPFYNIM